jgi:hypothetical protein
MTRGSFVVSACDNPTIQSISIHRHEDGDLAKPIYEYARAILLHIARDVAQGFADRPLSL